jgi:hypothetical protein
VDDDQALSRPIGWWLKEADARLDRAFDRAFEQARDQSSDAGGRRALDQTSDADEGQGLDRSSTAAGHGRRTWQVLSTLAAGPATAGDVIAGLAAFDSLDAIRAVLDELRNRGDVAEDAGMLRLTEAGTRTHRALAPLAGTVRRQVSAALPEQDYRTLVVLLARLVEGLDDVLVQRLGDGLRDGLGDEMDGPGDGLGGLGDRLRGGPSDHLTER